MGEVTDLAREYLDCFNNRDFDRCRELVHAEYTYRGGDGVVQKGPEIAVDLMRMWAAAFPDGRIEVERLCQVGDDTVVIEFIGRGTHDGELMGIAATGKKVEVFVCDVLQLRDGKIWTEHEYIDVFTILSQLGVAPELATV
jgi:steroid delta-isomerase-like uncharacterized protein